MSVNFSFAWRLGSVFEYRNNILGSTTNIESQSARMAIHFLLDSSCTYTMVMMVKLLGYSCLKEMKSCWCGKYCWQSWKSKILSWFTSNTNMEISTKWEQIMTFLFHAVSDLKLSEAEDTYELHIIFRTVPLHSG